VDALTKTLNRTGIDRMDQIEADARALRLPAGRVPVLVFVNSHFAGYAPDTTRKMAATLGGGEAPGWQRSHFGE
jgi:hypothetical protein